MIEQENLSLITEGVALLFESAYSCSRTCRDYFKCAEQATVSFDSSIAFVMNE